MNKTITDKHADILAHMRAMQSEGLPLTTTTIAEVIRRSAASTRGMLGNMKRRGILERVGRGHPWEIILGSDEEASSRPYAVAKPQGDAGRHDRGTRKCLCCGRLFLSDWSGNRLCRNCKSRDGGMFA